MKKINLLLAAVLFISLISCHDESGDYTKTYYTDTQLVTVIKQCLNVSVDSANNHLSMPDGFYTYKNEKYRITLPTSAGALVSMLTENGHEALLDTLILRINKAAEISGNQIKI
ncbi:MAG: DUF4197 domain-containing protein, partial [Bacteroidales bacterium]|nr:DUF4197 domain-containing protein [Bacteroidales bacterium]